MIHKCIIKKCGSGKSRPLRGFARLQQLARTVLKGFESTGNQRNEDKEMKIRKKNRGA
jgi:hypothetical protein